MESLFIGNDRRVLDQHGRAYSPGARILDCFKNHRHLQLGLVTDQYGVFNLPFVLDLIRHFEQHAFHFVTAYILTFHLLVKALGAMKITYFIQETY